MVAGKGFRFGRERSGDLELLRALGFDAREVPLVEGVSSTQIRAARERGRVEGAAELLGRPLEVEGMVVGGDRRGGTLGFPTANLAVEPRRCSCLPSGSMPARSTTCARRSRSASIRTTAAPSGAIEAYLLDWEGDLYGDRLVVELWQRLRDELRSRARPTRRRRSPATSRRRAAQRPSARPLLGERTAPLRRGSAPAPVRPTALTPPK